MSNKTLGNESVPDHDRVFGLIMAGWGTQVLRTFAEFSIAEHLDRGPLTSTEIASRAATDQPMTHRLLRAGVALGLLEYEPESELFSGTSLLKILHRDAANSLKYYALIAGRPYFWLPAMRLPEAVTRGENQVTEALGTDLFGYFATHEDDARVFSAAMSNASTPVVDDAVGVIDAGTARVAVDVGGADGTFVTELVRHNAGLTGVVLDLPHVVPLVAQAAARVGVADRVSGVAGDFFESIPAGDIFLLKWILHDWDDESCRTILANVRASMNPGARLFIVEMIVEQADANATAALMDIAMLFATRGQERGLDELARLLDAEGLKIARVTPLGSPYRLLEVVAAQ